MLWRKKEKVERKVRSDKKKQVAPTLPISLKKEIERLSFLTDQPIKNVGERLTIEAIYLKPLIAELSQYFQEGMLKVEQSIFFGSTENETLPELTGPTDRINIRFRQSDWENVLIVARHLRVTPSRATATLIESALQYECIVEDLVSNYSNRDELDKAMLATKKKLIRNANRRYAETKKKARKFCNQTGATDQEV